MAKVGESVALSDLRKTNISLQHLHWVEVRWFGSFGFIEPSECAVHDDNVFHSTLNSFGNFLRRSN